MNETELAKELRAEIQSYHVDIQYLEQRLQKANEEADSLGEEVKLLKQTVEERRWKK
jgi:phage shock protein A